MPTSGEGDITIEKSPAYFISKTAPVRINEFNPNMKLIVVLRDPVTRAISGEQSPNYLSSTPSMRNIM